MTKKVSKPSSNGATVTPTVDPKSIARCGIPAPSPKGRNNVTLRLAKNAGELLDAMAADDSSLSTVQSPERILTFYRKRLIEADMLIVG